MNSTGPACSLSSDQLRERRQELLPGLFRRADDVSDMPNGLRLRFAAKPGLLAELACIIEQEQTCCGFLQFHIAVEAGNGPITFDVTGPSVTREMLRAL
jgi:hypothetical protein